ncbi:MAG: response regulator [Ignavibacteriota bacterium]
MGLDSDAADLLCGALEQTGARAMLFDADQSPQSEAVGMCQLVVIHVRPDNANCQWLVAEASVPPGLSIVLLGSPEQLLALSPQVQTRTAGLLIEGCLSNEVLLRLRFAIAQPPVSATRGATSADEVVAYDETAAHPTIEAAMKEHGLNCRLAANGPDTILLLHNVRPRAAVLDVNLDGIEVLAAVRAEAMPVRTVVIASENQEEEILRASSLGAEDYLLQPFRPLELVARVKRLVG